MKTTTKIIFSSCIFCYFAGLWIIASRFGLVKLISRFGLAELFDQIPKDFPQVKYLYWGLIVYTVVYVLVAYYICRFSNRAAEEQEQLQVQSAEVTSYSELMSNLLSQYSRSQDCEPKIRQKLQTLCRQTASLPPAVVRNANSKSKVRNLILNLQDLLDSNSTPEAFSAAIDVARDEIDSIKRSGVTI